MAYVYIAELYTVMTVNYNRQNTNIILSKRSQAQKYIFDCSNYITFKNI